MDVYSEYKQIQMAESDAHNTELYVDSDSYHYTVIPFRLINAGATYQKMVNKLFAGVIDDTMETYFDNVEYLKMNIDHMRLHQVRIDLAKCAFGMPLGKFLGYMVSQRGIELNPEKLEAIKGMKSQTCHRVVQCLNGRLTTLNRLLAKSRDKSLAFFRVLRANKN